MLFMALRRALILTSSTTAAAGATGTTAWGAGSTGVATTTGAGFEAAAAMAASRGLDGFDGGAPLFEAENEALAGGDEVFRPDALVGGRLGAARPPGIVGRAEMRAGGGGDLRGGSGGGGGGSSEGTTVVRGGASGGSEGAGGRALADRTLADRALFEGSEPRTLFEASREVGRAFQSDSTASSKTSVAAGRS
jgi:hypothetical protein